MSALREVNTLDAIRLHQAVPARSRRTVHLSSDARQLVVFQYAGNPFSVIGVAFGRPGAAPDHVIGCPDPLDRDDVAARLEPVRDDLLAWLASYPVTASTDASGRVEFDAVSMPQLVVAGRGVIGAIDDLAYDWRYNPRLATEWAALGEELWVLAGLRHWPAQCAFVPLAETLAEHFDFGISPLESAKLAVGVAYCDAMGARLSAAELAAAEAAESGPLGSPDELDEPVWRAAQRGRGRVPAQVRQVLGTTWQRCNRAWGHLQAIPEANAALSQAVALTNTWAWRIGPTRTGQGFRRRRAMPALATAAGDLDRIERAADAFAAAIALEDPMVAAERAADGKGMYARCRFTSVTVNRRTTVTINADAAQPLVPSAGALCGIAGTNVRARLTSVAHIASRWHMTLEIGRQIDGTNGINTAKRLADGSYWFVVVPRSGPPAVGRPPAPPATHPGALGTPPPPMADDADDAD